MSTPPFSPYQNPALNELYALFFCDDLSLYQTKHQNPSVEPWKTLFSDTSTEAELLQIAEDQAAESRVRLLAAHCLKSRALQAPKLALHGVIIEVSMDEGLDVLAAFADGTARYLNFSERAIVWESPTAESNQLIQNLIYQSIEVVNRIGPWDGERLAPPEKGMVRLSFLVSGQLFFGQGPMEVFFKDPMAGPVLHAAQQLMQFLTTQK